ncbi:ABC transporter substrate-binding protein [Actinomycetaceae bacterium WB03_NA08]|uniref:ABC transporter substrate-binding protein n=1 Tax=Scrofimicrobium canadense TaxID=2652290 RepID=A0A6N7W889_9ACTO|nr:ABC transporter substrate-binding protein [Scrofimicrobium canadense]MSS84652.1 ABC transporter substrate-binding protein [Scrofimicrobium canadense]
MKTTRRSIAALAATLVLGVSLTACSDGTAEKSPASGTAESGATEKAGSGEIKKVGMTLQDVSNPFFAAMQNGMEEESKAKGFEINIQDGRQDVGTQSDQIDTFIQQGVDLILVTPVDTDGIGAAVGRAQAAGIPVVAVDAAAKGADAEVTTDNVMAGRLACEALVDKLGGKGNILIVDGTPQTAVQDRVKGCEEVLADNPEVKVLAKQSGTNDRASALQVTTDMLTANPDVNGIFAINDPSALGADLAVQQAGKNGIVIVGVDGSPEAVKALQDTASNFWATPAQDPAAMAVKGYEVGAAIVAGNPPADSQILIEPFTVDKDNVNEYAGW